jgi:hypothetical protein
MKKVPLSLVPDSAVPSQGGREPVPAACYDTDAVLALVDLWWLATGCPEAVPS